MRKLFIALVTLWFVLTLVFFLLRLLPGDAISAQLALAGATQSEIEQRRNELGLNEMLFVQYIDYILGIASGDMGYSLANGLPIGQLIAQQLPETIELATGAICVATLLGLSLGMLSAISQNRIVITFVNSLITIAIATPIYWTGTLMIALFIVELRWFSLANAPNSLILPVVLLGFHMSGAIARMTKISVENIREADYIRTAHSKGLPLQVVYQRHILRNALLPVISVIALQTGFLFSGTVITEMLFSRAGLGNLLLIATQNQDYTLVQGLAVFSAFVYIVANLIGEMLQNLLDPRV